jgi:hypothetical protein
MSFRAKLLTSFFATLLFTLVLGLRPEANAEWRRVPGHVCTATHLRGDPDGAGIWNPDGALRFGHVYCGYVEDAALPHVRVTRLVDDDSADRDVHATACVAFRWGSGGSCGQTLSTTGVGHQELVFTGTNVGQPLGAWSRHSLEMAYVTVSMPHSAATFHGFQAQDF